jgi:peptidoglycan hydrolase-like protein with peptidoglycan-binding domain
MRVVLFVLAALVAAPAFVAPALVAAQTADAAEIAFWNSVKDAKTSAELKAYLDKYPNGTFADLAKVRMQALSAGSAAKPAAPAAALTPAAIREAQAKLYALNYDLPAVPTGELDARTKDAVKRWQANAKRLETGDLTAADVDALRKSAAPTIWGAIAYNPAGGATTVWSHKTREDASKAAMEGCGKLNGGPCTVSATFLPNCLASVSFSGTVDGQAIRGGYARSGADTKQARERALDQCRTQSKAPASCAVKATVCADGSKR